jgi:ribosome-binding protein aMBF1 (putative translation factor)
LRERDERDSPLRERETGEIERAREKARKQESKRALPDADDEQVGAFSDALGRAREDAGVQQLIKDPQVKETL